MAASWEFDQNNNATSARVLLQRALRLNKDSKKTWLEYFRMEMLYVAKLRVRRSLLGLESTTTAPSTSSSGITIPLVPGEDNKGKEKTKSAKEDFLSGAVPMMVAQQAFAAFPGDLAFRSAVLDVCESFDSELGNNVKEYVSELVKTEIGEKEECWHLLAQKLVGKNRGASDPVVINNAAKELFKQALSKVSSPTMWEIITSFWESHLAGICSRNGDSEVIITVGGILLDAYQHAFNADLVTPTLLGNYISFLLRIGKYPEALEKSIGATDKFPESVPLWLQRIELAKKEVLVNGDSSDSRKSEGGVATVTDLYSKAILRATKKEALPLWLDWLGYCLLDESSEGDIKTQYERALRSGVSSPFTLRDAYLEWALLNGGLPAMREVYDNIVQLPIEIMPKSVAFFESVLTIELSALSRDNGRVRSIFEAALSEFGSEADDLWVRYTQFERSVGDGSKANHVMWRAAKCLKDDSNFNASMSKLC
jgi:U3 small nucleolar RNA-associated protein 6